MQLITKTSFSVLIRVIPSSLYTIVWIFLYMVRHNHEDQVVVQPHGLDLYSFWLINLFYVKEAVSSLDIMLYNTQTSVVTLHESKASLHDCIRCVQMIMRPQAARRCACNSKSAQSLLLCDATTEVEVKWSIGVFPHEVSCRPRF